MEKVKIKIPDVSGSVTSTAFNTKIWEVWQKFLTMINILLLMNLINFQGQYLMKKFKKAKLTTNTDHVSV